MTFRKVHIKAENLVINIIIDIDIDSVQVTPKVTLSNTAPFNIF